eukprot:6188599-Pleurochrysis_carterae.AAC.1
MSEDIWDGSPSLFSSTAPIGPHFKIDSERRGVQRYSFSFPDTGARIDWCAVYVSEEERYNIAQLHMEAASLLADGAFGFPDVVATESKYLPVGWGTLACGKSGHRAKRMYVLPASLEPDSVQVENRLRLPYARAQAPFVVPLVKRAAPWLGVAARAFATDPTADSLSNVDDFFDFPPRSWQSCADSQPHLQGHQLAFKLRGVPAGCPLSVAERLPATAGSDTAAMHTDGDDDGLGTIVYLNHKSAAVASDVGMPHADLVVASGRAGGRLVRIQTFSPNHVVCCRMDFRNCAHGNVARDVNSTIPPVKGVSQLRMIHYNRTEISQVVQYYRKNPSVRMLEGDRKSYLLTERRSLGIE